MSDRHCPPGQHMRWVQWAVRNRGNRIFLHKASKSKDTLLPSSTRGNVFNASRLHACLPASVSRVHYCRRDSCASHNNAACLLVFALLVSTLRPIDFLHVCMDIRQPFSHFETARCELVAAGSTHASCCGDVWAGGYKLEAAGAAKLSNKQSPILRGRSTEPCSGTSGHRNRQTVRAEGWTSGVCLCVCPKWGDDGSACMGNEKPCLANNISCTEGVSKAVSPFSP